MIKNTFINLATKDVVAARSFFTYIGLTINEAFSDASGICVVINDTTLMMVMTNEKFESFTKRKPIDNQNEHEVILSFEVEDKESVDSLLQKVIEAKGTEFNQAVDMDFMYYRSFDDLDGHRFEVFNFKK